MFRFDASALAALICLSATVAQAAPAEVRPSTPPVVPADESGSRDPQKVVCRKAKPPTGTRVQTRGRQQMCMTQADWDTLNAEAEAETRRLDNKVKNVEFLGGIPSSSAK